MLKAPSRHRILIRTAEVAVLLGVKESSVRMMLYRGTLVFSGDAVADFKMLAAMVAARESAS